MNVALVLTISVLLQFAAAILALRLIRITGRRRAWVLIATAISLMAIRRCITLSDILSGRVVTAELTAELVALVTSALMVVGVALIAPLFLSIKRSEEELREHREQLEDLVEKRTTELTAINKELEAFSYSVSHDLRAPLRAINGFSGALIEDYSDKLDAEGKRLLDIIRSNTKKMGQLIDDLLAFSRLGRQQMAASDVDMGKLAKAVFDEFKTISPGRSLQLDIQELPPAHGDRAMIRQVFVNLLSNAIKFTRPEETAVIEIGGYVEENENIYYIKDNGVGFDMQYINKLFGMFQRLHSVEEFEGTGVGLAIAQRIIHRHGGRVWAEGKVNGGATFYFTLSRETRDEG